MSAPAVTCGIEFPIPVILLAIRRYNGSVAS